MKTFHIICNPAAGRGGTVMIYRKLRAWADQRSDVKLVLHMTATASHATEITKELTSGNEEVIICPIGGDGTINEVVNGIVNFDKTTLAILPFGSGNDFVYSLGLKEEDPIKMLEQYVDDSYVKNVDYLLINGKYRAVNSIGLGPSAETIRLRNKMKHFKPKTQYKIATFRKSVFWKKFKYLVSFDNKPEEELQVMWFCANNGKRIGGKIIAAPHAEVDDGYISVMYIKPFFRTKTIPMLSIVSQGNIKQLHHAFFTKCKELTMVLNDNCVEYDGNLLEHLNALHVVVVPGKLRILLPNKNKNA